MSILIKGMEMPESCYYCPFADGVWQKNKRCLINGEEMPRDGRNVQQNHLTCPLIPVPPHGDLIDREYAIATACSGRIRTLPTTEDGEDWIRVNEVRESIKSAPTIIPADKDGET